MNLFWDSIIEPLLVSLPARSIVEIGSDFGYNTRNLLAYCREHGAKTHVIDPNPKYDVAQWQKENGDSFVFYRDQSLNAIRQIDNFDVVLVDGDHNWYTVFEELKLIEQRSQELEQPFPVVLLHDIQWPYGRRDLYYAPENIPPEYRKPYKKLGIYPGQKDLAPKGGLNQNECNAIFENDIQNGVLTAIEDFLNESKQQLDFLQISGLFGLGILIRPALRSQNKQLQALISELPLSDVANKYLDVIEQNRLTIQIKELESRINITRVKKQFEQEKDKWQEDLGAIKRDSDQNLSRLEEVSENLKSAENNIAGKNREVEQVKNELAIVIAEKAEKEIEAESLAQEYKKTIEDLAENESVRKSLLQKLQQSDSQIAEKDSELLSLAKKLAEENDKSAKLETKIKQLVDQHDRAKAAIKKNVLSIRRLEETVASKDKTLRQFSAAFRDRDRVISGLRKELSNPARAQTEVDNRTLMEWLEQSDRHFNVLLKSQRWRLGNALGDIKKLITRDASQGPEMPLVKLLKTFGQWKQKRNHRINLPASVPEKIIPGPDFFDKNLPSQKPSSFSVDFSGLSEAKQKQNILLVAHTAPDHIYGGERSLIDIVLSIDRQKYNIFCIFPAESKIIFNQIQDFADEILVSKYGWWEKEHFSHDTIDRFTRIMVEKKIDLVHVNTIMLLEPIIAARTLGIPSILHVRELIDKDPTLAARIGLDHETIVNAVTGITDYIIGNSKITCDLFNKKGQTFRLYNGIDTNVHKLPAPKPSNRLRVGLVSSNLPKKGIEDFALLAKLAYQTLPDAEFVLIGRINEHIDQLRQRQQAKELPPNLIFKDYQNDIVDCYRELDVVVNFSHFAESFGRTVAEAMAFSRPVICYQWGALPELVAHESTGFLIPYRKYEAALAHLQFFAKNPSTVTEFGQRGRERVKKNFSLARLRSNLNRIYDTISRRSLPDRAYRLVSNGLFAPQQDLKTDVRAISQLNKSPLGLPGDPARYQGQKLDARLKPNLAKRKAKLKIAYFLWHFPVPSETFVLNEIRYLVQNKFDVKVFCRGSPYPDFVPDFPIEYYQVRSPKHLASMLKKHDRNIVHSHFVFPTVTEIVWPACEMAGIPFTFIAHSQDIFRYDNITKNQIDKLGASPWCLRILVPGEFHRRFLLEQKVPAAKIVINPQAIEFDFYQSEQNARKHLYHKNKSVGTIGRFVEKKGYEYLIRAGKELAKDGITVCIYGYGPLEEKYREIIRDEGITNIKLIGELSGKTALRDAMLSHDLFVLPAVRAKNGDMDGIPTILMEAMATGVPVLTTSLSSIPDLVKQDITGLICPPNDEGALAESIREFYRLDPEKVAFMVRNAQQHVSRTFSIDLCVKALQRLWTQETVDIVLVSYHNLPQLKEVIRRIYTFTNTFFHLTVVDNASPNEVRTFLRQLEKTVGNMTLIENKKNLMVGPATNTAIEQGSSKYIFYICAKEGFILNYQWERRAVEFMEEHPDVGMAGSLGYSPSYFRGRDYIDNHPFFQKFRAQKFAQQNLDRPFAHVQGGLFVLRRKTYDEIGGFSNEVPHNGTDVEYSYYVESQGWKLGQIPTMLSLYNKTLPPIDSKIDESVLAAHPLSPENQKLYQQISQNSVCRCNVCGWSGKAFLTGVEGEKTCPQCSSRSHHRSLYRHLATTNLTYRQLACLDAKPHEALRPVMKRMFRYQSFSNGSGLPQQDLIEKLDQNKDALDLIILSQVLDHVDDDRQVLARSFRSLKTGGRAIIQVPYTGLETKEMQKNPDGIKRIFCRDDLLERIKSAGFQIDSIRHSSRVQGLDWHDLFECTKQVAG